MEEGDCEVEGDSLELELEDADATVTVEEGDGDGEGVWLTADEVEAPTVIVTEIELGVALAMLNGTGRVEVALATGESKEPDISVNLQTGQFNATETITSLSRDVLEERRILIVAGIPDRVDGCEVYVAIVIWFQYLDMEGSIDKTY